MRSIFGMFLCVAVGCAPSPSWNKQTFAYGTDPTFQTYDVYSPKGAGGPHPAVVFIHGGAWMEGSKNDGKKYADVLCRDGFVVISLAYRLSITAPWPAQIQDVRAALRDVNAHATELGCSSVGVMGASAGGQLALLAHLQDDPLAPGQRPACCVDISGEGDLRLPASECFSDYDQIMQLVLGHAAPYSPDELGGMSPVLSVSAQAHVLILHSIEDSNVYIAQGDALEAAFAQAGADYLYSRRVGQAHGDDLWLQDGGSRSLATGFLAAHLH
jgi:acetyl esterase/lipase